MFHVRLRFPALFAASVLAAFCSVPVQAGDDDHSDRNAYPTDVCVTHKLRAAADYCREAVWAWDRGDPSQSADTRLAKARERLASKWMKAEEQSLAAGVSCEETTATSDEMIGVLDAGAADLATAIATSEGAVQGRGNGHGHDKCDKHYEGDRYDKDDEHGNSDKHGKFDKNKEDEHSEHARCVDEGKAEHICESRRTMLAAQACRHLLNAEATHLRHRDRDRDRSQLEWSISVIDAHLAKQWDTGAAKSCDGGPTGAEAVEAVGAAAGDALYAALVSPRVSTEWTMITPNAEVPYDGKTLEPICSNGTPWVFFVKRGSVNKLLMYYQGGGACWDYVTCSAAHAQDVDRPGRQSRGRQRWLRRPLEPRQPVPRLERGLRVVLHRRRALGRRGRRPYERERQPERHDPPQGLRERAGRREVGARTLREPRRGLRHGLERRRLRRDRELAPAPGTCWPSSHFDVLGDAGNGVITRDFLENDISEVERRAEPARLDPGPERSAHRTQRCGSVDRSRRSSIRATASAHYSDGLRRRQGGQTGFYNVMLNPDNVIAVADLVGAELRVELDHAQQVQDTASEAPNYRYYIGTGSRHTMWGSNKVYTDTTGGVPTIVSWVNAMLDGTPAWTNVESTDPGLLLPGDPRPNTPPEAPYDLDAGRILCGD